jgi:non-specific serine/threonine protein kinase/serine/threonine-protein kinase
LDLLPGERGAFLSELPAEVREEVLSLLTAHNEAGRFLSFSDRTGFSAGERIGPYSIVELIGRGGMGDVYRARRDDGEFQREVAIKLVGGRLFAPEAERRFISERRILALLDHPNIVRMIDGGMAHGQRYLVMELVAGEPMTEYCSQHAVPIAARLRLFQSVCSAIQYAHQNLIIHRDLKPSNILVTPEAQAKVLDFGIAKLLEQSEEPDVATTVLHPMTLSCASPEQVREERLTLATDIYSLGLLLYELLTGTNPHSSGTRAEILQRIQSEDPIAPSKVAAGISTDLDAIVLKALAKEPGRRYASAEEMSADVERFLARRPVLARAPSRLYFASRFIRRNRALTAVAAGLILAVIVGVTATLWETRRAERRFNEVRSLAHSVLFEMYDSVSTLPGSLGARRLVVSRAQQYLDRLAQDATNDSSLRRDLAEAYLRLGDVQGRPYLANLGDTAGALASYRKALALLEPEASRRPADVALQDQLAQAYINVSAILMRQKNPEGTIEAARKAIAIAGALRTREPGNANYIARLSHAYMRLGQGQAQAGMRSGLMRDFQEALASYRKSLATLEDAGSRADDSWPRRLSSMHFYVGYALRDLGDTTGDISYYRQALEEALKGDAINRLRVAADPSPANLRNMADGLGDIGFLRWKCCRDLAGALRDEQEALAGFQSNAARDPQNLEAQRDIGNTQGTLGRILEEAGHRLKALEWERKALAKYEALYRADPGSAENSAYLRDTKAHIALLERQ